MPRKSIDVFSDDVCVKAEYKGKEFVFYPLSLSRTMKFVSEVFSSSQTGEWENEEELWKFVSDSLRTEEQKLRKTPGFLMFSLEKVMESIDFPFLLKHFRSLGESVGRIAKDMGLDSSLDSSPVSDAGTDTPQNTP